MPLSFRMRMLIGFLLANAALVTVAGINVFNRPELPPLIQGVLLPEARQIEAFSLIDHNNRRFTNQQLKGRWHLVSYGFTTCPDICPTTLSQLALVAKNLEDEGRLDLHVLFYSVDHRRDTVKQLQAYIPYFHPKFIGLTHIDDSANPHLPFEKSLGLVSQLVPLSDPGADILENEYQVNHGMNLYLINAEGELQAILEPDNKQPGVYSFDPQKIITDYRAIRGYIG